MPFTPTSTFDASSFSIFRRSLMQTDELPLADVIDSDLFARNRSRVGIGLFMLREI